MGNLKEKILKLVNIFFYYSGFYYILKFVNRKKVKVLMYHGVGNHQTDFNLNDPSLIISNKNFERQIKYLSKSCNIISLYELVNHIKRKIPFPPNLIVITFDDGLKNNFDNAFPILQKYGASAAFFLITDYIDTSKISWDNKFHYISKKISPDKFIEEFKKSFSTQVCFIDKTSQESAVESIRIILKYKNEENSREKFIRDLYQKYKIEISNSEIKKLYLSWDKINKMAGAGVLFGSHSSSHRVLSMLNHGELKREFIGSKEIIESKIHRKVDLFAYPYGYKGSFNSNIKRILANNGYLCAVSTIHGFNDLSSDPYELKRISISDEPLYYFRLRMEGFKEFLEKFYQKLSRYFKKNTFLSFL